MRSLALAVASPLIILALACGDDNPTPADAALQADAGPTLDQAVVPDQPRPDTMPAPDLLPTGPGKYGARCLPGKTGTCDAGLTCLKVMGQFSTLGYCAKTCTASSECAALSGASCVFTSGSSKLCGVVCDGDNPSCPVGLGCTWHPTSGAYFCSGDPPSSCGNSRLEPGEDCDGADLDNLGCKALGHTGGTLKCKACRFDTSACSGTSTCKLPSRRCTAGKDCLKLEPMLPRSGGDGFKVYTLSEWSYLRRDTFMLVKYAAAATACVLPGSWPISMADGSAKDGTTPKDSKGNYRHPPGSHANGVDIDVAYYQIGTKDNDPRPVCDETNGAGTKVNHCTAMPDTLDLTRSTFYLAKMFESGRIRVAGVDGKIGPQMMVEADKLYKSNMLTGRSLRTLKKRLRWEIANAGQGWYLSHHNHVHVSTIYLGYPSSSSGSLWVMPPPASPGLKIQP